MGLWSLRREKHIPTQTQQGHPGTGRGSKGGHEFVPVVCGTICFFYIDFLKIELLKFDLLKIEFWEIELLEIELCEIKILDIDILKICSMNSCRLGQLQFDPRWKGSARDA